MAHEFSSVTSGNGAVPEDDLDNLFNYEHGVAEFRRELDLDNINDNKGDNNDGQHATTRDVDEEVQIKKRRAPIPKLDETRLLSQNGISKLRRISKQRLKFKGKGHEFSDVARMLNMYQLWLDDLYPRAKFRDALTMVEKLGHTKAMQVNRRVWIDESKPRRKELTLEPETVDMTGEARDGDNCGQDPQQRGSEGDLFGSSSHVHRQKSVSQAAREGADAPHSSELDGLFAGPTVSGARQMQQNSTHARGPVEEAEPDDDELDALMAEEGMAGNNLESLPTNGRVETHDQSAKDGFEDEEEAMADIGGF